MALSHGASSGEDTPKARGVCHQNIGIITMRPSLLSDDNQFKATLLHELAHCLTTDERKEHGPRWHAKLIELIRDHSWSC